MPTTALTSPINEARAMIVSAEIADKFDDYAALKDAVEQKQLSDEIQKLGDMLFLGDDEAIKTQFALFCRARAQQDSGTMLSFAVSPLSPCNALYFNIAKSLYPEASFQTIFGILLPEVTTQWIAECSNDLDIDFIRVIRKSVAELENNPMASLPVELETFRRLVILEKEVFLLDPLAFFNFDLHCQLHQHLSETHRSLQQAIASHNDTLTQLYRAIERVYGEGSTPLSESELNELASRYTGREDALLLNLNGELTTVTLPTQLTRPFYKQIVIQGVQQLQEYLVAFPSTEYEFFLREVDCCFNVVEHLDEIVSCLNDIQHQALVHALIKGSLIAETDRLRVATTKNTYGFSALHLLAGNLDALEEMIRWIPDTDRLNAVNEKNPDGETVLQAAMRLSTPDALWVILDLLPESDLQAAITEPGSTGKSVLQQAQQPGVDPEFLQTMISYLPEASRLAVMPKEAVSPVVEDYSFYVNCLAGVAMVAGAGLVIKGILQPPSVSTSVGGLLVAGAGLATYGLFSGKNSEGTPRRSIPLSQPVECRQATTNTL